jgi:UDP-glucuronate decarboxylase
MNTTKNILVTGGAGFLGRHLCKKLLENKKNNVICIDNLVTGNYKNIVEFEKMPNFTFIQYDITQPINFPLLHEIYHLACIASPDKYKFYSIETMNTCFIGTQNMIQLAKIHNAKLLFTSTSEIYGDPDVHPQPEEYFGNVNTMGERSCYDEGKRIGETLIYEYRKKYGLDLKVVRIFNTYGPYMDINDGRVITNFIKQIMANEDLQIYGTGNQTRSFCYVDDLIDGLIRMMNSIEPGPINIGNPYCEFTLNELVQVFEKITNQKLQVIYLDATENDPKQRKPVITKAQNLLGFEPKITLEDGIKKTMDYFRSSTKLKFM